MHEITHIVIVNGTKSSPIEHSATVNDLEKYRKELEKLHHGNKIFFIRRQKS